MMQVQVRKNQMLKQLQLLRTMHRQMKMLNRQTQL